MPKNARTTVIRQARSTRVPLVLAPRRRKLKRRVAVVVAQTNLPRKKKKNRLGGNGLQQRLRPQKQRGMRTVTDGVNYMRTIHNGSVIEDTFQVRREKVSNIIGTTATTLTVSQALYLNPGNTVLFPIFSQIAATYEKYRVNKLLFSYETEAYTASGSNVSAGKVILATNYDPSDAQFSTDGQMENYYNSDRGAPFCEILHDVMRGNHAQKETPLKAYYVNSGANTIAPTSDSTGNKFYDMGLFQLGTQGNASATAEIGELYVTYSFTMIGPKQQTPLGQNFQSAHYVGSSQTTGNAFVLPTQKAGSNLTLGLAASVITFPQLGRYSLMYLASATSSSNGGGNGTPGAGVTLVTCTASNLGPLYTAGTTTATYMFGCILDVNSLTAATLTLAVTVVGGLVWDLVISQIPSGLAVPTPALAEDEQNQRIARLERILANLDLGVNIDTECSTPIHVEREESFDLSNSTVNLLERVLHGHVKKK